MICVNDDLRMAYIAIPKVASTACRASFQGHHADSIPDGYATIAVIRHPWDRLVSAVYSVLRSGAPLDERIAQHLHGEINSHIRPQTTFLPSKVDRLIRYENLARDWPWPLTAANVGKHRPAHWSEAPIDWGRWYPLYAKDFALCDWNS